MIKPVKDDGEHEHPVPEVWRPTLEAIVESMARGDVVIAADRPAVTVGSAFSDDCRRAVREYGDITLVALPEQCWETSVCIWQDGHWGCLVDLWTEEEGRSDLVLDLSVFEDGTGYRFEPHLVYVP